MQWTNFQQIKTLTYSALYQQYGEDSFLKRQCMKKEIQPSLIFLVRLRPNCLICWYNVLLISHFPKSCSNSSFWIRIGTMPTTGSISHQILNQSLAGHPNTRTLEVTFQFPGGVQGPEHPHPGRRYNVVGFPRKVPVPVAKVGCTGYPPWLSGYGKPDVRRLIRPDVRPNMQLDRNKQRPETVFYWKTQMCSSLKLLTRRTKYELKRVPYAIFSPELVCYRQNIRPQNQYGILSCIGSDVVLIYICVRPTCLRLQRVS